MNHGPISKHLAVRLATVADAGRLIDLIRITWPHEQPEAGQIVAALDLPGHQTWLILDPDLGAGRLAGFASCFPIILADDARRWQIDLLAVHPGWRRQGLGRRLVQAAAAAGQDQGALFVQALIERSNTASQQTFAAAGFDPLEPQLALYTGTLDLQQPLPHFITRHRPVPVTTLTYSGCWLEPGRWLPLAAAPASVSILIPQTAPERLNFDRSPAWSLRGIYRNWRLDTPPRSLAQLPNPS